MKMSTIVNATVALILVACVVLLGLVVFLIDEAFAADGSACYNIADGDSRSFCLARAHKDRSYCNSIKAVEIRTQCLAEVVK